MTRPDLPAAVTAYFTLADGPDKTRAADAFAPDAVVEDDGHTYRGREAILGWLSGPASEYAYTSTRLSAEQEGATAVVRVLLEGDFPGGRAELGYRFALDPTGQIAALTIAP